MYQKYLLETEPVTKCFDLEEMTQILLKEKINKISNDHNINWNKRPLEKYHKYLAFRKTAYLIHLRDKIQEISETFSETLSSLNSKCENSVNSTSDQLNITDSFINQTAISTSTVKFGQIKSFLEKKKKVEKQYDIRNFRIIPGGHEVNKHR